MNTAWRQTYAYDFAMRLFGSGWFMLLAISVISGMNRDLHSAPLSQQIARLCVVIFYVILLTLIMTRSPIRAEAKGIMPRLAAFCGTYLPWVIPVVSTKHAEVNHLSTIWLIVGMILVIATVLQLGRSFSIVPQARKVVRSGVYRWIRHPLYLAEEIAIVGIVLQFFSPVSILILIVHVTIQVFRIQYEETVLRDALPEYNDYAEVARWRLIPFIW